MLPSGMKSDGQKEERTFANTWLDGLICWLGGTKELRQAQESWGEG